MNPIKRARQLLPLEEVWRLYKTFCDERDRYNAEGMGGAASDAAQIARAYKRELIRRGERP